MVSKRRWKKSIDDFVDLVKKVKENRSVVMHGIKFDVFPNVFSPVYSSDTIWFAGEIIPLVKDRSFLEIGAGTGVIACLAAIHGAKEVTATDINQDAINNIRHNAKLHSLKITVKKGDVFHPIKKNKDFDLIFWNHPFYLSSQRDIGRDVLLRSVYDAQYKSLAKFFRQGKKHLKSDGKLLLGTSNVAKINLIKKMARECGYRYSLLAKTYVSVYQGGKVKMDLRIYEFTFPSV